MTNPNAKAFPIILDHQIDWNTQSTLTVLPPLEDGFAFVAHGRKPLLQVI